MPASDPYLIEARKHCIASQNGSYPHKHPQDSVRCAQCSAIAEALLAQRVATLRDVAKPVFLASVLAHWGIKNNARTPKPPSLFEFLRDKLRSAADRMEGDRDIRLEDVL